MFRALNDCGCATATAAGRIVGGAEVTKYSLPYQVQVQVERYNWDLWKYKS